MESTIFDMKTASEFDYQWRNLPDPALEYSVARVDELLKMTGLEGEWFKGKLCLDAGCGNGRYTWAMMQMGAQVDSIDTSPTAVQKTRKINQRNTNLESIFQLSDLPKYDLVWSYGVIHHTPLPEIAFEFLTQTVRPGGYLFVMVYHKDTQRQYEALRVVFRHLPERMRLPFVQALVKFLNWRRPENNNTVHGWWDALNPKYNYGFQPQEIREWFKEEGFEAVTMTQELNICMIGKKQ